MTDLAKSCESIGVKGVQAESDRMQQILLRGQENDSLRGALAPSAIEQWKVELAELASA